MPSTFTKSEQLLPIRVGNEGSSFDRLIADMGTCMKCDLCYHANQAVPPLWLGNLYNIDVMFIGEGPGADEDRYGKPFVGRAGQLLQDILQEVNLVNDIYITNVVKHRPPRNRKPTEREQAICSGLFLGKEITAVKPKCIVCLGRTPAEYLLRWSHNDITGSLRGKTFNLGGTGTEWQDTIPVFCTWHPAYILRRMDKKSELIDDINRVINYITQ